MIMFGQMAPSYLLWNGGILQLQDAIRVKIAAVLGCLAQVPHSYVWIDLRFFSARNSGEASAKKGYAEAGGRASRP